MATVGTISREDLKAKLDREDDFVLVEPLSEDQYQHAHLPGAVNIPPYRERELAGELIPDKDADVVVYCAGVFGDRLRSRPPVNWRTWGTRT